MPTDNCSSCGARLSPGIDWCGQCYARVPVALPSSPVPAPAAEPQKVLPPDFEFRVDQHLAALRTNTRPISKSAVFGVLALAVVMALAAEVAISMVRGPALVILAVAFVGCGTLLARLIWQRMKPAIPTR